MVSDQSEQSCHWRLASRLRSMSVLAFSLNLGEFHFILYCLRIHSLFKIYPFKDLSRILSPPSVISLKINQTVIDWLGVLRNSILLVHVAGVLSLEKYVSWDNSQRNKLWTDRWEKGIIFLRKIWNVCQEKLQIFYHAVFPLPHNVFCQKFVSTS